MLIARYINIIPEPAESVNYIKKYNFVEVGKNHWRLNFTDIKEFGLFRYFIKHSINDNWTVCNHEDLEAFINYYNHLK